MTLRNGQILYPLSDVLGTGPIAQFFEKAKSDLYKDVLVALGRTQFDPELHDENWPHRFYGLFLERILFYVREKQHGGMVIVIPESIDKTDTRITDRLNIKYACSYDYIWEILVRSLVNFRKYHDLFDHLYEARDPLTTSQFRTYYELSSERQDLDEALGDVAQAIAGLTSVDGAVVMTDRFEVLGFGAEVTAISPSLKEVVVSAGSKHGSAAIQAYGTRHRAAFRFCSSFEDCVVFVVSRDGGVKVVKRVGSEVILWPDINTGAMGL